jgi:DNA-directed RNA polymerase subunit RPC12/RpoP
MDDQNDFIEVRCGRCGKPLRVRVEAIGEPRTIDCKECAHERARHSQMALQQGTSTLSPR